MSVSFSDDLMEWVSRHGYHPLLGASHVQSNIENEIIAPILAGPDESRTFHVDVDGDRVVVK